MQTSNRILDDIAKVAQGAISTLTGIRDEISTMVRHRVERMLSDADLVPREEFEAVKAMAAKARADQERLEKRLAELEAKLARGRGAGKARPAAKAKRPRARRRRA